MVYLALKLVLARKKWLLIMVASFAIVISSVISIFSSTEMIKFNIKQYAFKQYGQFSGVLLNKSMDQYSDSSYGQFGTTGTVKLKGNRTATVGWIDKKYVELGHLKLQSGKFPVSSDEVAIESHYLKLIKPDWEIGTVHELVIGGESREFKLTGIVENYSARWSVDTSKMEFPNIFIVRDLMEKKSSSNLLIPFDPEKNSDDNYADAYNQISGNGKQGFINERLIYYGLKDLSAITKLTVFLQAVLLIISLLSITTLLSFFNANRNFNYAVLKSLGSTNRHLYQLTVFQTTYIFLLGTLLSLPLIFIFQFVITSGTYNGSSSMSDSLLVVIMGSMKWLIALYIIILASSILSVRQLKDKSMKQNFEIDIIQANHPGDEWISEVRSFRIKQLLKQIFLYPKRTILSLLTMIISIVVVLFAITFAKEAAGIWTTDIDYYLTAQETTLSKNIEGHTVLISKDTVYSPEEVRQLETVKGISWIDKEPSMLDVVPIIKPEEATPTFLSWVEKYGNHQQEQTAYDEDIILPNVRYILKPTDYWNKNFTNATLQKTPYIILYCPGMKSDEKENLTGKTITLSKIILDETGNPIKKSWNFQIARVVNAPYQEPVGDVVIERDEITFVLEEQYALQEGITKGYKDLSIYTAKQLSEIEAKNIYNQVYALAAVTPGGLFQYVSDVISDSGQMSELIYRIGNLTFYVSIFLSISCMYIVLNGKYQLHRRYWGIYRSLGMRLNSIYGYLLLEVLVYFTASALISAGLFTVFLTMNRLSYPMSDYVRILVLTLIVVFLLLIGASLYMKRKIGQDSISSLLRVEQ